MEPVVTAGLDGSPESLAAAYWAAEEAILRKRPLRLLYASILLTTRPGPGPDENMQNYWATRIVHDGAKELHESHPGLSVTEELVPQDPVDALLAAAEGSEVLALGSRGIGPLASFFFGDIGMDVVGRAEGPVALVREEQGTAGRTAAAGNGEVVVGLRLRHPCDSLFEFAFEAAALRGATLRTLHSRALPPQAYAPGDVDPEAAKSWADEVRQELQEALHPWRRKFPHVRVVEDVALESPARAVVHAAAGAELLIVGRRRSRPALVPAIAPVTHAAIHHAACPVVVMPYG